MLEFYGLAMEKVGCDNEVVTNTGAWKTMLENIPKALGEVAKRVVSSNGLGYALGLILFIAIVIFYLSVGNGLKLLYKIFCRCSSKSKVGDAKGENAHFICRVPAESMMEDIHLEGEGISSVEESLRELRLAEYAKFNSAEYQLRTDSIKKFNTPVSRYDHRLNPEFKGMFLK